MAIVILGGLVSSTFVSLVLVPPLAARWLYRS
jgi:Cu/Ag efflux pump CusA